MALQKTVTLVNSFDETSIIEDAYIRVVGVRFSKHKATAHVVYQRNIEGRSLVGKEVDFVPTVGNGAKDAIAQAYEHLKTLPEFSDAVDC